MAASSHGLPEPEPEPEPEPAPDPEPELCQELLACARFGEGEELDQLLGSSPSATALANASNESSNTALHMAAANGHASICHRLLQVGATVNAKNNQGNTPLHWAALNGHLEAVNVLLSHDASPFEMNALMRIALDEATAGDHTEVAAAIRRAGESKVNENQKLREKERANKVQAGTGSSMEEAAATAAEAAAEAAGVVGSEMDVQTDTRR